MPWSLSQLLRCCTTRRQMNRIRLITKGGHCNVEYGKMKYSVCFAYLHDIWSTCVQIRWYFLAFFYVASFIFSWFIFTLLWYWVGYSNGDLWWQTQSANHTACVLNLYDLTTAYLFSVETQLTIGFGYRVITPLCPGAITVFMVQVLTGMVITCFWCGVLIAKISLPKKIGKSVTFSERAVICLKQDTLSLQIRVANIRKSLLLGSKIYGKLIRSRVTPEGKTLIMEQVNINFMVDAGKDNLFFVCPLTLYHVIDKTSPFFQMAADSLTQQDFELVLFLDGTAESTSSSCQVRTSYLPQEIVWGHKFLPIVSRSKEGKYQIDFSNFDKVEPVPTAQCVYGYHNINGHHHLPNGGIVNTGFEVIEIGNQVNHSISMTT